ncbi:MAG: glycoside hydrolase family 13 protein [Firmicutes bacterium]|nr:glycoside hydrolase family 13 protein [Bacillota bacterium]
MRQPIHDIRYLQFRDPAGPCQAGSSLSITLLLPPDAVPQSSAVGRSVAAPLLCIRHDTEGEPQLIPLEPATQGDGDGTVWTVTFTAEKSGLYWYHFTLPAYPGATRIGRHIGRSEDGGAQYADEPRSWQLTVFDPVYADPDWIRGGIYYHVFVDRFAKSGEPVRMEGKVNRADWGGMPEYRPNKDGEILNNDFFGGNLAGIREKLPYLESLGVSCLYISPIFEAYSSHKYDTSDYFRVDPMFGTEEDFTALCRDAAARGIRVICDGVFSHTGADSRYFDVWDRYGNGAFHHPDSPYRDWYYFERDGYQTWWGIRTLPRINKDNPSYQEFITGPDGVVRHWLRAGASGWRLDVVDELPSAFLEKLTAAVKAEKPDALIVGEVWEDASNKVAYEERKNYFSGDKLDSVMNYPLRLGIIRYVRDGNAQALARPMETIMENYPARVVHALMNILGTHDTDRIITALAGQLLGPDATREEKATLSMDDSQWETGIRRLKIASALQMTLPGVPCIYYGDEAGMEGYNDPFNRKCYPWGEENRELLDWYRTLGAIRRGHGVYVDGDYRLLAAREGLFAFAREKNSACMITAANCGDQLQALPVFGNWKDLLSGDSFAGNIPVLPGQVLILEAVGR